MRARLIHNSALRIDQVPAFSVVTLDPRGFNAGSSSISRNSADWVELWDFALSFDGYTFFGGDSGAGERLGNFMGSVEVAFRTEGQLPNIDLALARACLFAQQRHWNKWGGVMAEACPPEAAMFLDSLMQSIRRQIT